MCERSRIEALKLVEKGREVGNPTAVTYLPKCDANGLYEEVQCLLSKAKCWCVEKKTGLPVAGKGVPDSLTCIKSMLYLYSYGSIFSIDVKKHVSFLSVTLTAKQSASPWYN